MDHRHITANIIGIVLLTAAPALAGQGHYRDARGQDDRRGTIEMLERRDQAIQREMGERKIAPIERDEMTAQRRQIDELIDDLEDGRSVSSSAIDEALGYPYHSHHAHYGHDHSCEPDRG